MKRGMWRRVAGAAAAAALATALAGSGAAASGDVAVPRWEPSDPLFALQWNLDSAPSPFSALVDADPDPDIDMPEAWSWMLDQPSPAPVYVGYVGYPVHVHHSELATTILNPGEDVDGDDVITAEDLYDSSAEPDDDGNGFVNDVWGWNFVYFTKDVSRGPGPGERRVGVMSALTGDGSGIAGIGGVARQVRTVVAVNTTPGGTGESTIEALDYLTDLVRRGVRMPVVMFDFAWDDRWSTGIYEALARLRDAGVLVVVPADDTNYLFPGEDIDFPGEDIDSAEVKRYPAEYDLENLLVVTGTQRDGTLAEGHDHGAVSVDLAAPGAGIWTTSADLDVEGHAEFAGESAAAAHVAAVASLVASYHPALGWSDLKQRILDTVVRVPALEGRVATGGRLNAWRALTGSTTIDP